MFNVTIQAGGRGSKEKAIQSVSDVWVWMQVYKCGYYNRPSAFRVCVRTGDSVLELETPDGESISLPDRELNELELQVVEIWKAMALNTRHYTPGAAMFFTQRVRRIWNQLMYGEMYVALQP